MLGRLPSGLLADAWTNAAKRGPMRWPPLFGSGSRTIFLVLHGVQGAGLAALPAALSAGPRVNPGTGVALLTALACCFGGCNVLMAALSRELFAPSNSGTVYGLALTSTATAALVFPNGMAACRHLTGSDTVYAFAAAAASFLGLGCCLVLRPLRKAFVAE